MQSPCVIVGIDGLILTKQEMTLLKHPLVDGVILFARNIANYAQLCQLTAMIKSLRQPQLTLYIDQEGGRVQRARCEPFTRLPSLAEIAASYARDPVAGLAYAQAMGTLMAKEILTCGIDISFAPVLDLNRGLNTVIGDRSFSADPYVVTTLARAYILGLFDAGMFHAIGKHFPGHGGVALDSHLDVPVDSRSLALLQQDILPFRQLIAEKLLTAIMPAHIIYPAIDAKNPAGFSKPWLQTLLRDELQFKGLIISDDLGMEGARVAGDLAQRAKAAMNAGCDKVLMCEGLANAQTVLDALTNWENQR